MHALVQINEKREEHHVGQCLILIVQSEVMEQWAGLVFKELGLDIYRISRAPQSILEAFLIHELAHNNLCLAFHSFTCVF